MSIHANPSFPKEEKLSVISSTKKVVVNKRFPEILNSLNESLTNNNITLNENRSNLKLFQKKFYSKRVTFADEKKNGILVEVIDVVSYKKYLNDDFNSPPLSKKSNCHNNTGCLSSCSIY